MKPLAGCIDGRRNIDATGGVRQRAVLHGIRAEFVQNHCQGQNGRGADFNIRTLNEEPSRAFYIEGIDCGFQDRREFCAGPVRLKQQVLDAAKREQPKLDRLPSVLQTFGGLQTLRGYGHHRGKRILYPVMHLLHDDALQTLDNFLLGGIEAGLCQKPAQIYILDLEPEIIFGIKTQLIFYDHETSRAPDTYAHVGREIASWRLFV